MNRALITIPLLQKDTTAKAACKREPLSGGLLTVSEGESTAIMVHSKAVGRQGGRCWSLAKALYLIQRWRQWERETGSGLVNFWNPPIHPHPHPVRYHRQQSHISYSFLNAPPTRNQALKYKSLWGLFAFKPPQVQLQLNIEFRCPCLWTHSLPFCMCVVKNRLQTKHSLIGSEAYSSQVMHISVYKSSQKSVAGKVLGVWKNILLLFC